MPDAADKPKGRAPKPATPRTSKQTPSEPPVVRLEIYASHAPAKRTRTTTRKTGSARANAKPANDGVQSIDITEQIAEVAANATAEREAELDAQAAALEEQAAALEARAAEFEARSAALEARAAEFETQAAALEARAAEIEAQAVPLEGNVAALDTRAADLDEKAGALDEWAAALTTRELEVAEREDRLVEVQERARRRTK